MDYTSFSANGTPVRPQDNDWWSQTGDAIANGITSALKTLERTQEMRATQIVQSARLYGALPNAAVPGIGWARLQAPTVQKDRLAFNVVQSAIDTITSKIAKNKPKPYFLTSGGNFKEQRKAKHLNKFTEGLFYECKVPELAPLTFRAAAIDGDGFVHVFEKHGRVAMERVPGSQLRVDEVEALYGQPRQLHRVMSVDRRVLEAELGKKKAIESANAPPRIGNDTLANDVEVRESWHLPSGPDEGDGLHVITVDGKLLSSDKWEHDFFPFARMQWCPRQYGYWSQGAAEQLMPIQIEINKLLWSFSRSYQLAGMSVVALERGSKIIPAHVNNSIGSIVEYTGQPPQYLTPAILPPEAYAHFDRLVQKAYEQIGVSMLSAASAKPAGLDSGKALREYNDIESDRFMTIGHAYEAFHLEIAALGIAVAKDIAEQKGNYKISVPARHRTIEVDWKKIDLDRDAYVMQCFPTSSLPNEPAGRFQTIQEWVQAGWYTPREGKKLMNFPDTEAVDSLAQAAEDWLTKILDAIVDDGEYTAPDPYDDLNLAFELALEYYQQGKLLGLDEERLDDLRTFMKQVEAHQQAAQQQQMAEQGAQSLMGAAANGPTQGVPASQPVSDILPNTPQMAA